MFLRLIKGLLKKSNKSKDAEKSHIYKSRSDFFQRPCYIVVFHVSAFILLLPQMSGCFEESSLSTKGAN